MPVARKVAASGSCPGYRQRWGALRELYGSAVDFLMRAHHLSCFGHLEELAQGQCAGDASQEEAKATFEPGESTAIGFSDTPVVGVGLLTGFFSVGVGLQRASSCPA